MSDYDYDLIAHTCSIQEITRVMKEQDADIERLKALVMPQIAEAGQWQELHETIANQRKLITELANALRRAVNILSDQGHCGQTLYELNEPLQQAREATKDE